MQIASKKMIHFKFTAKKIQLYYSQAQRKVFNF